ncbi:uncharacterized protein SEPMUDRAFT_119108 [Sphaerulina musiva SO2202]|uniref:Uncharacterized protein n=1 Tax=Sphaerulina musiva (strain SO2202) TaxID=692275 RepID=N1QFP0_SPHMS|nr:uncharacterized protein SEPMUDRAFT_119108 [Sphaerulina musiva SO2202]EMF10567.1 hypothetical protein SEPMUDRAFT_119108 [Sphaerulina musiva SO2202]
MQFKAALAVIAASAITQTMAAPKLAANSIVARGYGDGPGAPFQIDGSVYGHGIRIEDDGTMTWNYGAIQVIFHLDGTIGYKAANGGDCDVTAVDGPKGSGCGEWIYLTWERDTFPGDVEQCEKYHINCPSY